jgi:hypothetical protein
MDYNDHGGHCCGVKHIYGFDDVVDKESKRHLHQAIEDAMDDMDEEGVPLLEVILADSQLAIWGDYLKDHLGFEEVISWVNPNTNRLLTMLCAHQGTLKMGNL